MDEPFEIPVTYKGKEIAFKAQLLRLGYTHKFKVWIADYEVLYEPDEERTYRAVVDTALLESGKKIDANLLKAIAAAIEEIVR